MPRHVRRVLAFCLAVLLGPGLPAGAGKAAAQAKPLRTDRYGDPLPEGAIARLGTLRLRQPSRSLSGIAISPDGKFIVTAGEEDLTVRVWDAATGKEVRQLRARGDNVASPLAFSPDGALLAGGYRHEDGSTIIVWDFSSGKVVRRLEGHTQSVHALAFADDGKTMVALSQEGMVRWWALKTGKETRRWNAFADLNKAGRVYYLYSPGAFSADGTRLVVNAELAEVNGQPANDPSFVGAVWDLARRKLLWRAEPGRGLGTVSPDGMAVLARRDNALCMCDLLTGKEVKRLPLANELGGPLATAFTHDGTKVVVASNHESARVWDVRLGKVVKEFALPGWESAHVEEDAALFFPDGERVLLTVNNQLFVWNARTGKEVFPWAGHRQPVSHLAFAPDGKRLLSGSGGSWRLPHRLWTWDAATWKETGHTLLSEDELLRHPAPASLDYTVALVAHKGGTLHLYDRAAGKPRRTFEVRVSRYLAGQSFFSPNGRLAVLQTGGDPAPERLRIVDCLRGRSLCDLPPGAAKIRFAFARDNRHVAWFEPDDSLRVLDVLTGKVVWRLGEGRKDVPADHTPRALVFSSDGHHLAAWTPHDSTVRVWELKTGRQHRLLTGVRPLNGWERACALAFAPDGKTLATSSLRNEAKVELWELATGQRRRQLTGHAMPVTALAFSPDGRRLASGSADTTVLVWDVVGR